MDAGLSSFRDPRGTVHGTVAPFFPHNDAGPADTGPDVQIKSLRAQEVSEVARATAGARSDTARSCARMGVALGGLFALRRADGG